MLSNQPTEKWLSDLSVYEKHTRSWIPDAKRIMPLNTRWICMPCKQGLEVPDAWDLSLKDDQPDVQQDVQKKDSQPDTPQAGAETAEILQEEIEIPSTTDPAISRMADTGEGKVFQQAARPASPSAQAEVQPAREKTPALSRNALHQTTETTAIPNALLRWNPFSCLQSKDAFPISLPWYAQDPSMPYACYPWDGIEHLAPGQVPTDNAGFWLCTHFEMDEMQADAGYILGLEDVTGSVFVYLNGSFVGMAKGQGTTLAWDCQDLLQSGDNTLCLRLYPCSADNWVSCSTLQKAAGLSGAFLQQEPAGAALHKLDLHCEVSPDLEEARVLVEMDEEQQRLLHVVLQDPDGKVLLDFESQSSLLALDLYDLQLWSMENPLLYTLHIEILDPHNPEVVLRSCTRSFGLRLLENNHGMLMLNKKRLLIKGVYLAEDFFLQCEDCKEAFAIWKRNAINAIYCAGMLPEDVLALADAWGMAVFTDLAVHTRDFPEAAAGFERRWKKHLAWKLKTQWKHLAAHTCVLGIKENATLFPAAYMDELLLHLEHQNQMLVIPAADEKTSSWIDFASLQQAEKKLALLWEDIVFFTGDPSLEAWEAMQTYLNCGGLFLMDQNRPWTRALWSLDVQDLYTPWRMRLEKRGLRLENRNAFTPLDDYEIQWTRWKDGVPSSHTMQASIAPGNARRLYLEDTLEQEDHVEVHVRLQKDTPWAPSGYSMASLEQDAWQSPREADATLHTVFGSHHTSFYARDFEVHFDAQGLHSLLWKGKELLAGRPEVLLFDPWKQQPEDMVWLCAWSMARVQKITHSPSMEGAGWVRYDYVIDTVPKTRISITYAVAASGMIGADIAFKGSRELPGLGAFGFAIPFVHCSAIRVLTNRHVRSVQPALQHRYAHTQGMELLWKTCEIKLLAIEQDLQSWSLPAGNLAWRHGIAEAGNTSWVTLACQDVEYEESNLPNEAFRRTQMSFLMDLSART